MWLMDLIDLSDSVFCKFLVLMRVNGGIWKDVSSLSRHHPRDLLTGTTVFSPNIPTLSWPLSACNRQCNSIHLG